MNNLNKKLLDIKIAWFEQKESFYMMLEKTDNVGLLSLFKLAEYFVLPEDSEIIFGKAMLELKSIID